MTILYLEIGRHRKLYFRMYITKVIIISKGGVTGKTYPAKCTQVNYVNLEKKFYQINSKATVATSFAFVSLFSFISNTYLVRFRIYNQSVGLFTHQESTAEESAQSTT